MYESLGAIAALIAIGGFAWAIYKHFRPIEVKRAEALNEAKTILEFGFSEWRTASPTSKHMYLLSLDDFRKVVLQRSLIAEISEDERLYVFISSIVHGRWGDWFPGDIDSKKVLEAAGTLLDGRRGWRPIWRAAYLIERIVQDTNDAWLDYIPRELEHNENVKQVTGVIAGDGVVSFLIEKARGENPHLIDKSYALLQEIDTFDPGTIPPEFNKGNVL